MLGYGSRMINTTKSVALFGATGTIGRATARALIDDGHRVTCVLRAGSDGRGLHDNAAVWRGDLADVNLAGMDAVVSCLASRTGTPRDAWAVDHDLHLNILNAAKSAGVSQLVLLSAICVQKPLLGFQQAKLAFERTLQTSGLTHSIVRPTAFFKSLSGQVKRVQNGKPFLLFGDGLGTTCKPISDRDLGRYLSLCLTDPDLQNRVLPIGGPGPAITPRAQGTMIFEIAGVEPKFRSLPIWVMDGIIKGLAVAGRFNATLRDKAELARIGRYYATESMLIWDGARYDVDGTPSFGSDTLRDHYRALIAGDVAADLGDHAVF